MIALKPLKELAEARNCSIPQIAIAWVRSKGEDIFPLIGSRRVVTLNDSLKSLELQLSADEIRRLDEAYPEGVAAGSRYAEPMMSHLDSEKG